MQDVRTGDELVVTWERRQGVKVLIACEFSGAVRRAFRALGHNAWSCDLLPAEDNSPHHIQDDCLKHLNEGWDMMIAHPPCTYLCSSGLHWNKRRPERALQTAAALTFVRALLTAPVPKIALENPIGCISSQIRKPDQTASGQNKLGPSADRWKIRSLTYQGIADAMAAQWGGVR